jgi:hypothetical protein
MTGGTLLLGWLSTADQSAATNLKPRQYRLLMCEVCGNHYWVPPDYIEAPYSCVDCDALGRTGHTLRDEIVKQGSMLWLGEGGV